MGLAGRRVLLVIAGGVAAYKSLTLIRRLKERGASVPVVMTAAAERFVSALAAGALSHERVYTDLWSRADEHDIGHIRLARDCDAIVVAPATADLMAKLANGLCDDLASTLLLATNRPVLMAPAMNPAMWAHFATRANVARLRDNGNRFVGPETGEMAERGEAGLGRMSEPEAIADAVEALLAAPAERPLLGRRALVTSGPTHEPIDPVRFIANRSSGRQGHAIAAALARAGAEVTLVSGPVTIPDPPEVRVVHVETAREMLDAALSSLPVDVAVMAAAVADWRVEGQADEKIKKTGDAPPALRLVENPDILARVSRDARRPALVVGFAAETQRVEEHARAKLARKGCDWIVANDVSPGTGVMGGTRNTVAIISAEGVERWPDLPKEEVAARLVARIADRLAGRPEPGMAG